MHDEENAFRSCPESSVLSCCDSCRSIGLGGLDFRHSQLNLIRWLQFISDRGYYLQFSGEIPSATAEDVEAAVKAAREALSREKGKSWPRASGKVRAQYLRAIAAKVSPFWCKLTHPTRQLKRPASTNEFCISHENALWRRDLHYLRLGDLFFYFFNRLN